jgi:hypothetical protein
MNDRPVESVVADFLRSALAGAAVSVPNLETMARAAGLPGKHQHRPCFKRCGDVIDGGKVGVRRPLEESGSKDRGAPSLYVPVAQRSRKGHTAWNRGSI